MIILTGVVSARVSKVVGATGIGILCKSRSFQTAKVFENNLVSLRRLADFEPWIDARRQNNFGKNRQTYIQKQVEMKTIAKTSKQLVPKSQKPNKKEQDAPKRDFFEKKT